MSTALVTDYGSVQGFVLLRAYNRQHIGLHDSTIQRSSRVTLQTMLLPLRKYSRHNFDLLVERDKDTVRRIGLAEIPEAYSSQ